MTTVTPVPTIGGLPYSELAFDRDARPVDASAAQALVTAVTGTGAPTDLVVLAHGWNDDEVEARALFTALGANLAAALAASPPARERRVRLAGVLWPSKRFADPALIPGGAAFAPGPPPAGAPALDAAIHAQLDRVEALTGADLAPTRRDLPRLPDSAAARHAFTAHVLALLPRTATEEEAQPAHVVAAAEDPHFLARLGTPVASPASGDPREPRGGAASLLDWPDAVAAGAFDLLNYTTYYVMRDRAGRVGRDGLAPALARLRAAAPALRLHLVGHSFGARLATAAAAALPAVLGATFRTAFGDTPGAAFGDTSGAALGATPGAPFGTPPGAAPGGGAVASLALLQAAFSHYAFARGWDDGATRDGLFRPVVAAPAPVVRGPTLVTHSTNDHVVGLAYALASRVAGQIANAIGGPRDPYGALGFNGALKTPEAVDLRLAAHGEPYAFAPGRVYNLDASGPPGAPGVIASHTDVRRPEIAHAIAEAIRTSP